MIERAIDSEEHNSWRASPTLTMAWCALDASIASLIFAKSTLIEMNRLWMTGSVVMRRHISLAEEIFVTWPPNVTELPSYLLKCAENLRILTLEPIIDYSAPKIHLQASTLSKKLKVLKLGRPLADWANFLTIAPCHISTRNETRFT